MNSGCATTPVAHVCAAGFRRGHGLDRRLVAPLLPRWWHGERHRLPRAADVAAEQRP